MRRVILLIGLQFIFFACNKEEISIKDKIDISISVESTDGSSSNVKCNLINESNLIIVEYGFCWNTLGNPSLNDEFIKAENLDGTSYSDTIESLIPSTIYFIKAYVIIDNTIIYSEQIEINTTSGLAYISTNAISEITDSTAICGGEISENGGYEVTSFGVCWSLTPNPTIEDFHTNDGKGLGSYLSKITGLIEGNEYYVRAYATNEIGISYGNEISFVANETVEDYDGNIYEVVTIGNQTWMAENVRSTHYADGTEIQLVASSDTWSNFSETRKAMCFYNNLSENADTHGALYTWAAAMNGNSSSETNPSGVQGVCPDKWHLPSESEWEEMINYLSNSGYLSNEGSSLKSSNGWENNGNGTNNFGFNALPSGSRRIDGSFSSLGQATYFWSATGGGGLFAFNHYLTSDTTSIQRVYWYKKYGYSVRCIKDVD